MCDNQQQLTKAWGICCTAATATAGGGRKKLGRGLAEFGSENMWLQRFPYWLPSLRAVSELLFFLTSGQISSSAKFIYRPIMTLYCV